MLEAERLRIALLVPADIPLLYLRPQARIPWTLKPRIHCALLRKGTGQLRSLRPLRCPRRKHGHSASMRIRRKSAQLRTSSMSP